MNNIHMKFLSRLSVAMLLLLMPAFVACSDGEDDQTNVQPSNAGTVVVQEKGTSVSQAPSWQPISDFVRYSSEVLIISSDSLPAAVSSTAAANFTDNPQADSTALMASFIGDECRGVAHPYVSDGKFCFNLQVVIREAESTQSNLPVELRFYSPVTRRVYTSSTFHYVGDEVLFIPKDLQLTWN